MREHPEILIVEDEEAIRDLMALRLEDSGYVVHMACDGVEGLERTYALHPDLILTDVTMPRMDGMAFVEKLRNDPALPFIPIIMITALAETTQVVSGLDVGADEYIPKPVAFEALLARVKSMLRIKELHDTVQAQAGELAELNRGLEQKVHAQLAELQQLGRLRRFLAPQVAEAIIRTGGENLLESHRQEVSVVFCDLRGYTAFTEAAPPETVMEVLGRFHECMGDLVHRYEGTLERFTGDGMMVFFNDPQPMPDHALQAVRMGIAMQERLAELSLDWKRRGYDLDMGVGIAKGKATLGMIGFEGRRDYSAIGTVTNLAARLCNIALGGEVLVSEGVHAEIATAFHTEALEARALKGFADPVPIYRVLGPALRLSVQSG